MAKKDKPKRHEDVPEKTTAVERERRRKVTTDTGKIFPISDASKNNLWSILGGTREDIHPTNGDGHNKISQKTRIAAAIAKAQEITRMKESASHSMSPASSDDEVPATPAIGESREERNKRTLFIGNVPLQTTKRQLLKALGLSVADIELVKFRSIPVHPKFRKNILAGVATQQMAGTCSTMTAYVQFRSAALRTLRAILAETKEVVIEGRTLRYGRADKSNSFSKFDRKRTVFVGNLPVGVDEEELRGFFKERVGNVCATRIVRDRATSVSKLFGFVMFEDRMRVPSALALDGEVMKGHNLNIEKALQEERAKAEKAVRVKKSIKKSEKAAKKRARNKLKGRMARSGKQKEKHG